jgi:cell division protein FtsW (lipid II flippase)
MTTATFFLFLIPILAVVLFAVNLFLEYYLERHNSEFAQFQSQTSMVDRDRERLLTVIAPQHDHYHAIMSNAALGRGRWIVQQRRRQQLNRGAKKDAAPPDIFRRTQARPTPGRVESCHSLPLT